MHFKPDKVIFGSVVKHFVVHSIYLGSISIARLLQNSKKELDSSKNALGYYLGYFED
jgi:hypothetical protein